MKPKAATKSANSYSRWSLPTRSVQPRSARIREFTWSSERRGGRGMGLARRRRGKDAGALHVLVANFGHVELLDVGGELLERLLEGRQSLALAGERCRPREDEILHVRVVDPALLDLGHHLGERLVGFHHQGGALLALRERLREVALEELVHAPEDGGEGAAREALVLLVEETQGHEVWGLELEGVVLLAARRLLLDQAPVHAD